MEPVVTIDGPEIGDLLGTLILREFEELGQGNQLIRLTRLRDMGKVVIQTGDQQPIVGKGKGKPGGLLRTITIKIDEVMNRPVEFLLWIAAKIDALQRVITGTRVDQEAGVYPSFKGGPGDQPCVKAVIFTGGAQTDIDQMEAGAGGAECGGKIL